MAARVKVGIDPRVTPGTLVYENPEAGLRM